MKRWIDAKENPPEKTKDLIIVCYNTGLSCRYFIASYHLANDYQLILLDDEGFKLSEDFDYWMTFEPPKFPKKEHFCGKEEIQHGGVLGLYQCYENNGLRFKASSPLKGIDCLVDIPVSYCPFCGKNSDEL